MLKQVKDMVPGTCHFPVTFTKKILISTHLLPEGQFFSKMAANFNTSINIKTHMVTKFQILMTAATKRFSIPSSAQTTVGQPGSIGRQRGQRRCDN
jgi:hypothetical protein